MRYHKTRRMVTDATTGERTAVVADGNGGRAEWVRSIELRRDRERAIEKNGRKDKDLAELRRMINVT